MKFIRWCVYFYVILLIILIYLFFPIVILDNIIRNEFERLYKKYR